MTGSTRSAVEAVEALPSRTGMTPAQARAAEVLGVELDPDETVALAGAWLGANLYTPALCDLAASDWDDPGLPALWRRALAELGVSTPSPTHARRLLRAYLDRRCRPVSDVPCTCHGVHPDRPARPGRPVLIPRPRSATPA